ncbi:MAG: hypothetical protein JST75_06350 [Bacteroidetes bacterium]|nr:hypothetical protein [Bacteroidota bacterium]
MSIQAGQSKKSLQPVSRFVVIFIVLTVIIFLLKSWVKENDVDYVVLLTGNTILFLATVFSFLLYNKALQNNNPNVFIRFIYGGMLMKMVICLAAAVIYILLAKNNVSKFGLFGCFILYIIYTFAEVKILMQLSKQQKNV